MKAIAIAVLCCATALGCTWLATNHVRQQGINDWLDSPLRVSDVPMFEIHEESGRIFVFDKKRGAVWRYFLNRDEKGNLLSEGFSEVKFVSLTGRLTNFADRQPAEWIPEQSPTPP